MQIIHQSFNQSILLLFKARLIIAGILCPPLIAVGVWLSFSYHSSGNLIFRTVGANTEIQNMCKLIFVFFDLLKFDLQLSVSVLL
jgi:hypothetical protein